MNLISVKKFSKIISIMQFVLGIFFSKNKILAETEHITVIILVAQKTNPRILPLAS